MKNLKKIFFITICVIVALIASNVKTKIFIVNPEQLLPLLFTLLGLSITSYTFISTPINDLVKDNKNEKIKKKLQRLLESFEEDMMLIFILAIVIVILDIIINIDIPLVKDIEIQRFNIVSLKMCLYNFFTALSAMLSFYALYDLIKATFKILKKSLER